MRNSLEVVESLPQPTTTTACNKDGSVEEHESLYIPDLYYLNPTVVERWAINGPFTKYSLKLVPVNWVILNVIFY